MEKATEINKPRSIRHNSQSVADILSEYKKGELTVKEFCANKGINPGTFYCWLSKGRKNKDPKPGRVFVPVTIKGDGVEEKVFAEYKGLKFYQEVSVDFLKALIG